MLPSCNYFDPPQWTLTSVHNKISQHLYSIHPSSMYIVYIVYRILISKGREHHTLVINVTINYLVQAIPDAECDYKRLK